MVKPVANHCSYNTNQRGTNQRGLLFYWKCKQTHHVSLAPYVTLAQRVYLMVPMHLIIVTVFTANVQLLVICVINVCNNEQTFNHSVWKWAIWSKKGKEWRRKGRTFFQIHTRYGINIHSWNYAIRQITTKSN